MYNQNPMNQGGCKRQGLLYSHCWFVLDDVVICPGGESVTVHGSDGEIRAATRLIVTMVTHPVVRYTRDVIVPNLQKQIP